MSAFRLATVATVAACACAWAWTTPAVAGACWQLAVPGYSIVACGRAEDPARIAEELRLTQRAVAWMLAPVDSKPPTALVLALPKDTIDEYFGRELFLQRDSLGYRALQGYVAMLPQASIVIFTPGLRGQEYDQLRYLYAGGLLGTGRAANWPDCVRFGMQTSLTTVHRRDGGVHVLPAEVYFPFMERDMGGSIPARERVLALTELVHVPAGTEHDFTLSRRAMSCFLFSRMALAAEGEERVAFRRWFDALGAGVELEPATRDAFGTGVDELNERWTAYAARVRGSSRLNELRFRLDDAPATWPPAERISPERLRALLLQLRARMFGDAAAPAGR